MCVCVCECVCVYVKTLLATCGKLRDPFTYILVRIFLEISNKRGGGACG